MFTPSPHETEALADQLLGIGVLSHDQHARAVHLGTVNTAFAAAFKQAALSTGEHRASQILQLVGPPDGSPPPAPAVPEPVRSAPAPFRPVGHEAYRTLYTDAYRVVRVLAVVGALAKGLGILVFLGCVFLGGVASQELTYEDTQQVMLVTLGVMSGMGAGLPLFFVGVLISAQGQLLRATLDTAVNTSRLVLLAEERWPRPAA